MLFYFALLAPLHHPRRATAFPIKKRLPIVVDVTSHLSNLPCISYSIFLP